MQNWHEVKLAGVALLINNGMFAWYSTWLKSGAGSTAEGELWSLHRTVRECRVFLNPRRWIRKSKIFDFQTARSQPSGRVRSSP